MDLERRLAAQLAALNAGARIPGVALGLIHEGRELVIGHGVTNAEHPLPVDGRTLFQIASLTKPFTATALLRLVDEGRVELDAPVTSLLRGFRLAVPEWSERVRVQDLLTHVGGWLGDHFFMTPPSRPTLEALVEEFASAPQLFEPGTLWSYNNAGFSVAGRVVEVVTGEPFAQALRELVLAPLGLSHTFLRADEVVTHRVAAPHRVGPRGPVVLRGGGWQPGWELQPFDAPAGGLVSCVADLLVWARFQWGDGRAADGTRVLRPETLARMHAETRPAGCDDDAVGLAWLLHDRGGARFSGHTGQTAGYLSKITIQRERRFGLAILTNAVVDGGLRRDLEQSVLRECLGVEPADPAPLADPGDLGPFEGRYDHPFAIQHLRRGEAPGELVLESEARPRDPRRWQPPPPPPVRYRFHAPDRLVAVAPAQAAGARAEFGRDARGRVAWLRQGGRIAPRLTGIPRADGPSDLAIASPAMTQSPFRVLPRVTARNEHFWSGGARGELCFLRCAACRIFVHPPSPRCPACLGKALRPEAVSGRARVLSYTWNHQAWVPAPDHPYPIAIVEIAEQPGLRLMTNLVGCEADEVRIGLEVRAVFERHEDVYIPLFEPVRAP